MPPGSQPTRESQVEARLAGTTDEIWGRASSAILVGIGLKGPWLTDGSLGTGQKVRQWAWSQPDRVTAAIAFAVRHSPSAEAPVIAGKAMQILACAWACR